MVSAPGHRTFGLARPATDAQLDPNYDRIHNRSKRLLDNFFLRYKEDSFERLTKAFKNEEKKLDIESDFDGFVRRTDRQLKRFLGKHHIDENRYTDKEKYLYRLVKIGAIGVDVMVQRALDRHGEALDKTNMAADILRTVQHRLETEYKSTQMYTDLKDLAEDQIWEPPEADQERANQEGANPEGAEDDQDEEETLDVE